MVFPRQVLNGIKWQGKDMRLCHVSYLHRGAPGDLMTVRGDEIDELGRSFFSVRGSSIPYHRIRLITYDGEAVYYAQG